jgi:hypothetical protein
MLTLREYNLFPLFVAPGSSWENGYVESFIDKLRDKLLNRELFSHIDELNYVVDCWHMDYNPYRRTAQ